MGRRWLAIGCIATAGCSLLSLDGLSDDEPTAPQDAGDAATASTDAGVDAASLPPATDPSPPTSQPSVVIGAVGSPVCVAVDVVNVYWGAGPIGSRRAKAGGSTATLKSGGGTLTDCIIDATDFYALERSQVFRTPKGGSGATVLGYGFSSGQQVAVSANPTLVFWTNPADGTVSFCNRVTSGCTPSIPLGVLASDQQTSHGITSDGTSMYWANRGDGRVMRAPAEPNAGGPTTVAEGQSSPGGVAVDARHVYWVNQTGALMRADKDGSNRRTLALGPAGAEAIALDDANVYWVTASAGTVMKIGKDGSGFKTLASGQRNPWDVAVDDTDVYWANNDSAGAIMKVAK